MKKNLLKHSAIASLAAVALTSCGSEKQPEKKDINILWLFGEDISPWMPLYGDNTVETPYINFLAENGVTFENCFAPCPVSSPTRSALMTGMMQTSVGAHNHRSGRTEKENIVLPEGIQILPQMMKEHGFHTYNNGKDDFNWMYDWNDYWNGTYEEPNFHGKIGTGCWGDRKEGQNFFGVVELYGGKNKEKLDTPPTDPAKIKVPSYYPDCDIIRKELAKHYDQIMLTDNDIKNQLDALKKDGLYENTIIIFLSDNGYKSLRDKQFLYDGGTHMPLVIAAPGNHKLLEDLGAKIGSRRSDLVSLIDVTATTLAMAGIDIPEYMESQDLFADDFHHDFVVSARDRCDFTIDRIRSIRTKDFKYIRNFMTDRPLMQPQYRDKQATCKAVKEIYNNKSIAFESDWLSSIRPAEELYDIKNDPDEVHNLADDPKYSAQLEKMRGYLKGWIKETDDKGQYPETEAQLEVVYERWGDRCVNPEYDKVKSKKLF